MSPIAFLKDKLTYKPKSPSESWGHFYEKNEALFGSLIFIGGFLFDIVTLSDVDDSFSLIQQSIYLVVIALLLVFESLEIRKHWQPPRWLVKAWPLREIGIHFLLGSLLSLYSLFFFKSASLATSLLFMLVMVALLVANEFPQLQRRGPLVRWALWTLSLLCLMLILVPMAFGRVGVLPFIVAWILASVVLGGVMYLLSKGSMDEVKELRSLFWPSIGVLVLMLVLYIFKVVPPVPLVLQDVGIYHNIEKAGDTYLLTEDREWWRFWARGDQNFRARPGDKIFVYVAVASPASIQDEVRLRWMFKDPRQGWLTSDLIPLKIRGGRGEGYRGYAMKSRYEDGDWRVQVETTDEREIGRINFTVTKVAADTPAPEMRTLSLPADERKAKPIEENEATPVPTPHSEEKESDIPQSDLDEEEMDRQTAPSETPVREESPAPVPADPAEAPED